MEEENQMDPEYQWIIRTCMNGFNIYLTMIHLIINDNLINMQLNDEQVLSYPVFMALLDLLVYCSL